MVIFKLLNIYVNYCQFYFLNLRLKIFLSVGYTDLPYNSSVTPVIELKNVKENQISQVHQCSATKMGRAPINWRKAELLGLVRLDLTAEAPQRRQINAG